MDQPSNSFGFWPPCFDQPPSPMPNSLPPSDDLFHHDFILQCINKHKQNANWKHDEDYDITSSCNDTNNNNKDLPSPLKKRARSHRARRIIGRSPNLIGILRNNNLRRQLRYDLPAAILQDDADDAWKT